MGDILQGCMSGMSTFAVFSAQPMSAGGIDLLFAIATLVQATEKVPRHKPTAVLNNMLDISF